MFVKYKIVIKNRPRKIKKLVNFFDEVLFCHFVIVKRKPTDNVQGTLCIWLISINTSMYYKL